MAPTLEDSTYLCYISGSSNSQTINYRKPEKVLSPRDAVKGVKVLYDGGENSISLAKIKWYDQEVLGIRWNVAMREWDDLGKINGKECLGMPTLTGHPVWFIIPDALLDENSEMRREIDKAMGALKKPETLLSQL